MNKLKINVVQLQKVISVVSGVQNRGLRILEMSLKKRNCFSSKECEPIKNSCKNGEPEVNSKVEE
jgi:hypothetical protein